MLEVLESNIRKQNSTNAAGIVLAFSMVFGVCFGVNAFVGPKGPMPGLTIPFLLIAIVIFIIWIVMYRKSKIKMVMTMDKEGEYYITVPLKEGGTLQLNKISAIEPIYSRISLGKGPRIKDVYLKIYDDLGNNSFTVYTQLGAIHEAPDEFFEMDDHKWMSYDKGKNIYASKDVQEIYYTLKGCKWVTVRQPSA
jgi:hypothetical protein